jgi:hypothetical protein
VVLNPGAVTLSETLDVVVVQRSRSVSGGVSVRVGELVGPVREVGLDEGRVRGAGGES